MKHAPRTTHYAALCLLSAICHLLSPLAARAAAPVPLSTFGTTNAMSDRDLFAVSIGTGTNEHLKGMSKSNVLAGSFTVENFIFAGSSLSAEVAAHSGLAQDWPTKLMQKSHYANHGPSANLAIGGSTLAQWSSTYWDSLIAPRLLINPSNTWIFLEGGVNDLGSATITNDWSNLVWRAKSSNVTLVVTTVATNTGITAGTLQTTWSNFNAYIVAATNRYDFRVNLHQLVTNATVQTMDGTHWNGVCNDMVASNINALILPPKSSAWKASMSGSSPVFDTLTTTNEAQFKSFFVTGAYGTTPTNWIGAFWEDVAGQALHIDSFNGGSSAYGGTYLSAGNIIIIPHGGGRFWVQGGSADFDANPSFFEGSNSVALVIGSSAASALNPGFKNEQSFLGLRKADDSAYVASVSAGSYYPSNGFPSVAAVTAHMTNGGFWIGTVQGSNSLLGAWMSNNVTTFKNLVP